MPRVMAQITQKRERRVQANGMVLPSLRSVIEAYAEDNDWTFSKAVAKLIEKGAEAEKLFDRYAAKDKVHAKAA